MTTKAVWVPRITRVHEKGARVFLTDEQIIALRSARKARAAERARRNAESRRRAWTLLADAHPDEFATLLTDMTEQVDAERGALPEIPEYNV